MKRALRNLALILGVILLNSWIVSQLSSTLTLGWGIESFVLGGVMGWWGMMNWLDHENHGLY